MVVSGREGEPNTVRGQDGSANENQPSKTDERFISVASSLISGCGGLWQGVPNGVSGSRSGRGFLFPPFFFSDMSKVGLHASVMERFFFFLFFFLFLHIIF